MTDCWEDDVIIDANEVKVIDTAKINGIVDVHNISKLDIDYNRPISSYDDMMLLKLCTSITILIKELCIKNRSINDNLFTAIGWFEKSLLYFTTKYNQRITTHTRTSSAVVRNSYSFCDKGHRCGRYYDKNQNSCNKDHLVFNKIYSDVISLVKYLKLIVDDNIQQDDIKWLELETSINTITYAINQIYKEYSARNS